MKILYIHTGRLEESRANVVQMLEMCRAFTQLGHDVVLAVNTYSLTEKQAVDKVKEELGVPEAPFEVRTYTGSHICGRLRAFGCISAAMDLGKSIRSDYTFLREPVIYPFVQNHCAPVIFEAHNNKVFTRNGPWNPAYRRIVVSASQSSSTAVFITISAALAEWWKSHGVPEDKILALHDAVNPDMFTTGLSSANARVKLSLPADKKIVLYAGSLFKDRCIPDILKLAEMRTDALFVIVGDPDEARVKYEKDAGIRGLHNVVFTGRVPHKDIPLYLTAADILLMLWSRTVPTINYCSPLKVFEYMAAGRIIVGHSYPTIREVLEDGKDAYLARPGSLQELAAVVNTALDKPDPEMAQRARGKVLEAYTWKKRCETIIKRIS